jgi:hypothetical protein
MRSAGSTLLSVIATAISLGLGCTGEFTLADPVAGPDAGGEVPDAAAATPRTLLAQWSGCMTFDHWQASNMAGWAYKATEGGTVCSSCHGDGLARFDTHIDAAEMFQRNRYETFITGFFTLTSDTGALDVAPALEKLERVAGGDQDHPTFPTGQADPHIQALERFYQLTIDTRAAGGCGPADFPAP